MINELIIGCYCVECEYFAGECRLNFDQSLKPLTSSANRRSNNNNNNQKKSESENSQTIIKSLKLFGVDFNLNIDQIPGIQTLERLEITNLKTNNGMNNNRVGDSPASIEFRSAGVYPNLTEFHFKNNNLKSLNALNVFYIFSGLRVASFAQNLIDRLDRDTFKFAGLKSLEQLNLERNKLVKIDRVVFAGGNLVNLRELNLNQNLIEGIDERAFVALEKLEILDLTRNK